MDTRGLSGLPLPALTCQVFVLSGFDASDGVVIRSWVASQTRSASYWRWAAVANSPALCTGWSGATTSIQPIIVGPSTRLVRSEEHTSELQSHSDLVCRLLLE